MILLVKESAKNGAEKALADSTYLSAKITKSEAYRRYGRSSVDRWLQEGLLKPVIVVGKKSPTCIDRKKLEAIAASSNRHTYLSANQRTER